MTVSYASYKPTAGGSDYPSKINDFMDKVATDMGDRALSSDVAALDKTALHAHSNKTALDLVSGENTGDQDLSGLQATLVSGTNIKTINSQSLLGSGDITISGGGSTPYGFFKSDSSSVVFTKTAARTISIKAGTSIMVASTLVTIATDTAVVMPSLTGGTDYAIYACTDGTVRADASFTNPTGYTTNNSRMIGGFHYGLVAAGTTVAGGSFATTGNGMIWTQADVDKIAGVNQYSLWDLKFRPLCDPRGMALCAGRTWVDIYFCGTNHIANGTSKAGTDIASGTVLPRKPLEFGGNGTTTYPAPTWWDFSEIVNSHKKRLIHEQEFVLAAFGVTENQSIDATASTYPTTQRNAGYTSKYGLEQASGHHYTWGEDSAGSASAWVANGGRGQSYNNSIVRVLLGGNRTDGANSGSRCVVWSYLPANCNWYVGVRAAADHTILI